jgi:cytoskeletal protein CcmA (bactofilin family)
MISAYMFGNDKKETVFTEEFKAATGTRISKATTVIGNIETEESVVIEGSLTGDVTCTGSASQITVCEEGFVEGNIVGPHILIEGVVNGNIDSSDTIKCGSRARVLGHVVYTEMQLELGAEVTGNLSRQTTSSVGGSKYQDFKDSNDTSYE